MGGVTGWRREGDEDAEPLLPATIRRFAGELQPGREADILMTTLLKKRATECTLLFQTLGETKR